MRILGRRQDLGSAHAPSCWMYVCRLSDCLLYTAEVWTALQRQLQSVLGVKAVLCFLAVSLHIAF